jgi:hypothetical protein
VKGTAVSAVAGSAGGIVVSTGGSGQVGSVAVGGWIGGWIGGGMGGGRGEVIGAAGSGEAGVAQVAAVVAV